MTTPVQRPDAQQDLKVVLYGDPAAGPVVYNRGHRGTNKWETKFEGVISNLSAATKRPSPTTCASEFERYMAAVPCQTCGGARLKPESRAVTVGGKNIIADDRR